MKQTASSTPQRISHQLWRDLRSWLLENDPDAQRMLTWSDDGRGMPANPDALAGEIIWIILCAGRSAQAARTIEKKVWNAIRAGQPVVEAFGYRAKAAAIDRAWRERESDFAALMSIEAQDPERLVAWCKTIPFVGDDTQFQLAKNLGADLCKPDIWLCRLAGFPDKPRKPVKVRFPACMALCRYLAEATSDKLAAVDSLLWLACNKGMLQVSAEAGEIRMGEALAKRSIFATDPQ
ncbi:hypothetical protein KBW71_01040 [Hydrogenophaga aromaticivorans]|uniref:hypothetical protein n=1 Tax=Hydrogenophaga aromaticivorans TaxID=2610898 RepID=UPI001B393FF2|nr:hypothetical protein [Hydrogenophaga aromaticivorans]MBQ0917015.1 hypothetical protein [Hydrogenophaga aromaticivorans]